jgi:DNA-binding transcriptional regulator LsrR (DeoR family)
VPNGLPPTPADRYRTALALHEQGLDQESIAARAGLEQEVVRMLLTLGPPAQTRH